MHPLIIYIREMSLVEACLDVIRTLPFNIDRDSAVHNWHFNVLGRSKSGPLFDLYSVSMPLM